MSSSCLPFICARCRRSVGSPWFPFSKLWNSSFSLLSLSSFNLVSFSLVLNGSKGSPLVRSGISGSLLSTKNTTKFTVYHATTTSTV
uniref:Uncharacterized protein n=1 Tax=Arundo donax TaxID=35708 RepID=A0A0A8XPU0_ARUDO